MPDVKRVAMLILGAGLYGREAAQGCVRYSLSRANWEIHYEGVVDPTSIRRIAAAISHWPADGAILQSAGPELLAAVDKAKIPTVLIGGEEHHRAVSVCPDNSAVGASVAQYFHGRGFVHLAYCGVLGGTYSQRRQDGFCGEAASKGCTADVLQYGFLARQSDDWMIDYQTLAEWLQHLPKPVGIMGCNDLVAREIVAVCSQLGIRVPDEVAVVGVDDDNVECSMSRIPLTSVRLPAAEIGFRAAEVLDRMMGGRKPPARPVLLGPTMVVTRQSSDVYMIEQPDVRAALQYIRDNASMPITVADILKAVPVSRRWIEKQFASSLGRTIRDEILKAHAEHAKRLLAETDLKISTIARKSGYSKYQVFPRLFKETTGVLPSEYRRRSGKAPNADALESRSEGASMS